MLQTSEFQVEGVGCMARSLHLPYGSKDTYFKAFGPKDHTIRGFRAMLSLRVTCDVGLIGSVPGPGTGGSKAAARTLKNVPAEMEAASIKGVSEHRGP